MTLGEQIKNAREKKNLSQEELAFQLGVSRQAVSKWENGSSLPQGIHKEMLTQILNIEIEEHTITKNEKMGLRELLGWVIAILLAIIFLVVWIHNKNADAIKVPNIKSITFYDCNQDVVSCFRSVTAEEFDEMFPEESDDANAEVGLNEENMAKLAALKQSVQDNEKK